MIHIIPLFLGSVNGMDINSSESGRLKQTGGYNRPLLSRIRATPGSWEFFAQLSPQLQNRMAGYVRAAHSPEEQQWRIEQVCEALKARDRSAQWQ